MKERQKHPAYESPTLVLLLLDTQDVLTASGGDLGEWDTEL